MTAWFATTTPAVPAALVFASAIEKSACSFEPEIAVQEVAEDRMMEPVTERELPRPADENLLSDGGRQNSFHPVPVDVRGLSHQREASQRETTRPVAGLIGTEVIRHEASAFGVQIQADHEEHQDRLLRSGGISSFSSGVPPPRSGHHARRSFRTGPDRIRQASLQGSTQNTGMWLQVQARWTPRSLIESDEWLSRDPPDERRSVFSTSSIPSQRGA